MNAFISTIKNERFLKFAVVGISGTIVDFAIFNILSIGIRLSPIIASIISFIIAVFNNYYWNRNWTYPESKSDSSYTQLMKFFIVSIIGLGIRTILFRIIENPLIHFAELTFPNFFISTDVIGHNLALALLILVVLFWNYFANRLWTYRGIDG